MRSNPQNPKRIKEKVKDLIKETIYILYGE
jgi:hypothetical protein